MNSGFESQKFENKHPVLFLLPWNRVMRLKGSLSEAKMKIKRTPIWERDTYVYYFSNGDRSIVSVGKVTSYHNGTCSVAYDVAITKETIAFLHKLDDKEVRDNLKAINFEDYGMRKERLEKKKQWDIEHPNEENPYDKPIKVIHLNSFTPEATLDMIDNFLYRNSSDEEEIAYEEKVKDLISQVDAYVATLSEKRQILYRDYFKDNLTQEEIAKKFGVSKNVIKQDIKRLKQNILKNF